MVSKVRMKSLLFVEVESSKMLSLAHQQSSSLSLSLTVEVVSVVAEGRAEELRV